MTRNRKQQPRQALFCPLCGGADARCRKDCALRMGDGCAFAHMAMQQKRQGDELFTIAEILMGAKPQGYADGETPFSGAEPPSADRGGAKA